jgi:hypothetical protein
MADPDADARHLDDEADREELRSRWYGLLQELRVVLPGAQVLLAFLLTAPFSERFDDLDDAQRAAYVVAVVAGLVAVVSLIAPTVFHRVVDRTKRKVRLAWGVRMAMIGTWTLAVALLSALWCVLDFTFGGGLAWVLTGLGTAAIAALWIAVPLISADED